MTGFESDFDDIDDTPTLDDLWAGMVELTARIDDLATHVLTPTTGPNRGEPTYPTVEQWVQHWWAVHLERDTTGSRSYWCTRWTEHPEAVSRLTALWQRWEELNAEWVRHGDLVARPGLADAAAARPRRTVPALPQRRHPPAPLTNPHPRTGC